MLPSPLRETQENKWLVFLIGLAVLVNLSGLTIPLMDPDAGVYATVSKNMVLHRNYFDLIFQGHDWLDKPHFPFWATALFFKIFGIHTWSYKLPGILFVFIGAIYTYNFAKQYYSKTVALWSVFILLTAQHIIISNNDVRAEPFLTGLIIASVYHFSNSILKRTALHFVLACFFAACAVMTKGIFTLIPIGGAVAGELIIKKNWKQLFNLKWIVAAILIAVFITPELYSLWHQFDQHPEKVVFGRQNVSGIRFFLWDSQFGRFLNTGPIKGKGDPFFFWHTLLWAFLPWSLLMYAAIFTKIKNGIQKLNLNDEWFTLCGSLLTLIVFSFSKFQLPYYTNIIFPFLAILTAQYIKVLQAQTKTVFTVIQNILALLLLIGGFTLQYFYGAAIHSFLLIILLTLLLILFVLVPLLVKTNKIVIALYRTGLVALALNFYLDGIFYPDLLTYQSSDQAAFYINKNFPGTNGVVFNIYAPAFEFYLNNSLQKADSTSVVSGINLPTGIWYVTQDELLFIQKSGRKVEIVKELDEFHVTMLTAKFINKKTRSKELKKYYLIKVH
jgi:4-amino-4-deoxy-L-arabinose transferase-like glycosyltransferase